MGCGVNKIGGNSGNVSGNADDSGSMFFVWQAGIESEAWVSRLSLLAGASIIAIFPSRNEAVDYAIQRGKADKKAVLVAERRFSFAQGDCNNLISECAWAEGCNGDNGNGNNSGEPGNGNDFIKRVSEDTQIIKSDFAFANGNGIFGTRADGRQHILAKLGSYNDGTVEQVEIGSTQIHLNLNSLDRPSLELPGGKKETLAFEADLLTGVWATPYINSEFLLNDSFSPDIAVDTGIELEDAAQYRIIISAMGGSTTGNIASLSNFMLPVVLNSDGTLHSHLLQSPSESYLMIKGIFEFRWQESDEGDGRTMIFASTLGDAIMGTVRATNAPNMNRLDAMIFDFDSTIMANDGAANVPIIIPTGNKLRIGFMLPQGADAPPNCNARMLLKVESCRGQVTRI